MTPEQQKLFGSKQKMIAFLLLFIVFSGFLAIWGIMVYSTYFVKRVETIAVITRERGSLLDYKGPLRLYRHSVIRLAAYEVDGQTYKIPVELGSFTERDIRRGEANVVVAVMYNPQNPADGRIKWTTGDHGIWIFCIAAISFVFIALMLALKKSLTTRESDVSRETS